MQMVTPRSKPSRQKGEADRFTKLVSEYRKAPEVTRERLYLDTMRSLQQYQQGSRDRQQEWQSNLLYLPLDKMVESGRNTSTPVTGALSKRRPSALIYALHSPYQGEVADEQ